MLAALASFDSALNTHVWNSAHQMIAEVGDLLSETRLISLDHDLYLPADEPDPGDGLMVAKHLASRPPVCPVIIHSTNHARARMMEGEFELAGWTCKRVAPVGEDWIRTDWLPAVTRLIGN